MKKKTAFIIGVLICAITLSVYVYSYLTSLSESNPIVSFLTSTTAIIADELDSFDYYVKNDINLGAIYEATVNPNMKYVAIVEGMRKEEIAKVYQKALGWSDADTQDFAQSLACYPDTDEGKLFPAAYVVDKDATPDEVKQLMLDKFNQTVKPLEGKNDNSVINLDTVVRIASIIQREAGGKKDMRLISGIIWNRLFNGMTLDIDATLQYVKGQDGKWWPQVTPADKYLDSPFNTYKNLGLPPSPISNPGLAAIEAAFNPQTTSCLFYIHDKNRNIHCAKTYEEHKKNIEKYLK